MPKKSTTPGTDTDFAKKQLAAALKRFAKLFLTQQNSVPLDHLQAQRGLLESIETFAHDAGLPCPIAFEPGRVVLVDTAGKSKTYLLARILGAYVRNALIKHLDGWLLHLTGETTDVSEIPSPPLHIPREDPPAVDWQTACTKSSWDVCDAGAMLCGRAGVIHTPDASGVVWSKWPSKRAYQIAHWLATQDTPAPGADDGTAPETKIAFFSQRAFVGLTVAPRTVLERCDDAGVPVPDEMRAALKPPKKKRISKKNEEPTLKIKANKRRELYDDWCNCKRTKLCRTIDEYYPEMINPAIFTNDDDDGDVMPPIADIRKWISSERRMRSNHKKAKIKRQEATIKRQKTAF